MAVGSRLWRWLKHGRRPLAHELESHACPLCGTTVAGKTHATGRGHFPRIPPSRTELIARCPTHGAPPYNDPDFHQWA